MPASHKLPLLLQCTLEESKVYCEASGTAGVPGRCQVSRLANANDSRVEGLGYVRVGRAIKEARGM